MRMQPHSECALSGLGDGVPPTFLNERGFATLAAWRRACVATALTTAALAWEEIPIHVLAADISLPHTDIAAAAIATSAHELCALSIPASSGWQLCFRILSSICECALGITGDGVPPTFLNERGFATLAARCRACIATALATSSLAWEGISIHVLAADISLPNTDVAAAAIATSAHKLCALSIPARSGWQLCFRLLSSARECALSIIGDRVPPTFLNGGGFATLAARRRACVATALAAVSLAWE